MAWKKKLGMDVMTSLPTGVATWSRISSFVKRLIKAYQFEFYEFEALEVESVVLNGKINRGTITGTFVRPEGDSPGAVLPLIPNKLHKLSALIVLPNPAQAIIVS